jgi:outer membrane immunogenic protein
MKKILLGTVGLIALGAAPVLAADLPARTYSKAPAYVAAVYDWSGFYIGGNGGYGSSRKCWDLTALPGFAPFAAQAQGCHDATGGTAGGQIGYRWQASNWVFGIEGQGNWADLKGSNTNLLNGTVFVAPGIGLVDESKIRAFGLLTGQVGYAWNNALLYVKGGAAVTDDRYRTYTAAGALVDSASETRWGAAVGGGFEYGFTPNWSFAVEYDHMFLGRRSVNATSPLGAFSATDSIKQDVDLVTARINYRWGGPVVAKY